MLIESLHTVFYMAIFIVPGYIMKTVIDAMNPKQRENKSKFFISCLVYSFVNCALSGSVSMRFLKSFEADKIEDWVVLIGIAVLSALILSVPLGWIKQKKIIFRIVSRFRLNVFDPTPTAWDYVFAKQEASLVLITLTDDSTIYGWYGNNSRVSSDPDERDVFLEAVYRKNKKGQTWEINPDCKGIYIPKNMIKHIVFQTHNQ